MKRLPLLFTILLGLSSIALSQNNVIYYTSTDGEVVKPDITYVFGTTIISNTYTNGKGVITFDNNVTEIGIYAFSDCKSLTSITIPESVTKIGEGAFYECSRLRSVYCKPTIPPVEGCLIFFDNASDRKIYVPRGSVQAYKWDWSDYTYSIVGFDF